MSRSETTRENPICEYFEQINDGRIVTGRYIRMIYKYLVDGVATGRFQYDGLKANAAIEWIEEHCFHTEGPLAPGPLKL